MCIRDRKYVEEVGSMNIMFRASTMGVSSSISCIVKYRLRSMLVASTMLMMPVGCLLYTSRCV